MMWAHLVSLLTTTRTTLRPWDLGKPSTKSMVRLVKTSPQKLEEAIISLVKQHFHAYIAGRWCTFQQNFLHSSTCLSNEPLKLASLSELPHQNGLQLQNHGITREVDAAIKEYWQLQVFLDNVAVHFLHSYLLKIVGLVDLALIIACKFTSPCHPC